jgi:hypothetical protein
LYALERGQKGVIDVDDAHPGPENLVPAIEKREFISSK